MVVKKKAAKKAVKKPIKKAETQADFILLDRSASMITMWKEALASVNVYAQKLADDKVPTKITLAVFDTVGFDVIRSDVDPKDFKPLSEAELSPRASTPLNDATGKLVALAKAANRTKTAIIIMTDGEENASHELTVLQAKMLLDECRTKGWQVVFLGANFDNARQATSYGTASANTISTSSANLTSTMSAMSAKRSSYSVAGQAMTFSDDEKAAALDKGIAK